MNHVKLLSSSPTPLRFFTYSIKVSGGLLSLAYAYTYMIAYTYPMTSLILFVDGLPVRFEVEKTDNFYILKPLENPFEKKDSPTIKAIVRDSTWHINGTTDQNLIDQIQEDLSELPNI